MINKAYYEVMTEGDKTGQLFTFPIPTVNITEDFDWYGENTDLLFENTAKIGSSYFQNFIGSQYKKDKKGKLIPNEEAYKPNHVRSMCCRLQLDLRELLKRGGGLFGSAEMTGSIGVVTLNMARLGFLYKGDKNALFIRLNQLMHHAKNTLEKKRLFIQNMYDRGLFPYTKRYLQNFNNHFSTIGVNGINEMIRNFTSDAYDISSDMGIEFATEILNYMRDRMVEFQKVSSAEVCRKLVKNVISNFRLPYITVTPLFSVCPKHGYISGEHEYCPKCDEELINEFRNQEEQVSWIRLKFYKT